MKSIREIYKIGKDSSSSPTMGPERAAILFRQEADWLSCITAESGNS